MKKLRALVIGCGRMGTRTNDEARGVIPDAWLPMSHAEALRSLSDTELVGFCDTDLSRAQKAARDYAQPGRTLETFTDYRQAIETLKPDLVTIATRTPGRETVIRFAVEHGVRGIYAEKPLTQGLEDSRALVEFLKKNSAVFLYGTVRRYMAAYREAREQVVRGAIGELREIQVQMGRGNIFWTHPHSVDLWQFFNPGHAVSFVQGACDFTTPVAKGALGTLEIVDTLEIDDDPIVRMGYVQFENGVAGSLSTVGGCHCILSGTEGNLFIASDAARVELHRKSSPKSGYFDRIEPVLFSTAESGMQSAMKSLVVSVREGAAPLMTLDEVGRSQELLFALVYSALENGRRVKLSDLPAKMRISGRLGEWFA